jgi:hypothetical protein
MQNFNVNEYQRIWYYVLRIWYYTIHRLGRGVVVEVTKYSPQVGYNFLI